MIELEKLQDVVHLKGTGIPNLSACLVKRYKHLFMYECSDGAWEVFLVKVEPAGMLYGK